jgi:hypothetical protein
MKAACPPSFWASDTMCRASVVLPEDSGPKISTTLPRGTPPMPRAKSRPMEPVGMNGMTWCASSDRRMIEPLPYLRSMVVSAVCRASRRWSSGAAVAFLAMGLSIWSRGLVYKAEEHSKRALSGQLRLPEAVRAACPLASSALPSAGCSYESTHYDGLALFSGGLDSILAVKVVQAQGLRILGLHFMSPFFGKPHKLEHWKRTYGIEVVPVDVGEEFAAMLRSPSTAWARS